MVAVSERPPVFSPPSDFHHGLLGLSHPWRGNLVNDPGCDAPGA